MFKTWILAHRPLRTQSPGALLFGKFTNLMCAIFRLSIANATANASALPGQSRIPRGLDETSTSVRGRRQPDWATPSEIVEAIRCDLSGLRQERQ
jgi:hypothetical protein